MSQTLSQLEDHTQPRDAARPRGRAWSRWVKLLVALLIFLWFADLGVSLLIRHTRLQRRLTARLEAVFGRSVEVGSYDFSLWGGPTLEAHSVTFGEDPRFGHEYFLRADSLTVRLRWQSFFRGHMELGAIALQSPSLNLVRNSDGDWNVAEWLPKSAPSAAPSAPSPAVRFGRIDVSSGRINFKRGDEKLPFALTNVNGYMEPDSSGRWTLNLEAVPSRAAVLLQQAGTIRVSGHVGGTSSRLRPAVLDLAWNEASLSDLLHLTHGYDFGVRGDLGLVVHAETQGNNWALQGRAELRRLHRWDFAVRPDNPAVNVNAKMILYPLASGLDITEATIEAPHSFARADAHFAWPSAAEPEPGPASKRLNTPAPAQFEITQSQLDLSDVLAWIRAFHSDVAADVSLRGSASVRAGFSAWPLHLTSAAGAVANAELASVRLRVPAHLAQAQFRYDHEMFSLLPATVSYGASDGAVHVEAIAGAAQREFPVYHLSGNLTQVRDLVATAGALGWNISRGWDLAGPVRCDLRWQGARFPWETDPVGTVEWGGEPAGASLLTPFLNQPVKQIRARAELKPGLRHIALTSADAFGARWTGTFDRHDAATGWRFALSTDALSAADLDRWLNPRWRQSFLDRMLPFLNSSSPANAVPENLRAEGHIGIEEFALAPVALHHLQGEVKIGGRHVEVSGAKAQFFGGALEGTLDAQLATTPAYHLNLDYSHVELAALTGAFPTLTDLFAGAASGEFALDSSGATRADLVSSLECRGNARISDAKLQNINLLESMHEGKPRPGVSAFPAVSAVFACGNGKIIFQRLRFTGAAQDVAASGSVDFSRDLRLQLRVVPAAGASGAAHPAASPSQLFELTGPVRSPDLQPVNPSAPGGDEQASTEQRN
ncbi:MAG: AsmA-like C-terminal region-containing protein [Candidatus Acidiferrales bacterium]